MSWSVMAIDTSDHDRKDVVEWCEKHIKNRYMEPLHDGYDIEYWVFFSDKEKMIFKLRWW